VREPDGLAMSSRNSYLNNEERKAGSLLYKALKEGETLVKNGISDASYVKKAMEATINSSPMTDIEYIEIVDPLSLEKVEKIEKSDVMCLAVKIGKTRLIDNLVVE
jgi:pantoate--beta-alanine ligase